MKKSILSILTLATTLAGGALFGAVNGDVYEIRPCDSTYADLTGAKSDYTRDYPMVAGDKAYFYIRLQSRDAAGGKWYLDWIGSGSQIVDDLMYPMQIGIFTRGDDTVSYATLVDTRETGSFFTDFIFEYTVKAGDFALPIILATMDSYGNPARASDTRQSGVSYYFNPARATKWVAKCVANKGSASETTVTADWLYFDTPPFNPSWSGTRNYDYSLEKCNFYAKTVDFDRSQWDEGGATWRTIHKNSSSVYGSGMPAPRLAVDGAADEAITYYVWSTNEDVVTVYQGSSPRHVTMTDPNDGFLKTFLVACVTIKGGQTDPETFDLWGVSDTKNNGLATLILSAYPEFHYSDGTGKLIEDFLTIPVKCTVELPASVKVAPGKNLVTATSDYGHYVTTLDVSFTQKYSKDVAITITPSFENGYAGNWGDYIRFSTDSDVTALPAATAPTVTIPANSLTPTDKLYIFALRGDANTIGVANHLQFTATTTDPDALADIKNWNTVQGAMNIESQDPEIVSPVEGDASMTAMAGADRTLRIQVADAYANMTGSEGYEVYITRNSDTETAFTKLDGVYKPGQGNILFKVGATDVLPTTTYTVTGENKSILYIKSVVSGNQSAERKFTVNVSAPASVTIDTSDGNYTFTEGDDVAVTITLDRQNATGGSLYAFLVPITTKDENAADCSFLAKNGCTGLEIGSYGTSVNGYFTLVDGCSTASTSQFGYKVELRTARVYEDGAPVTSYTCKNTLILKSSNVIPTITGVEMGLNTTDEEGKFPGLKIAKDVTQTFKAIVEEPGLADLNATGEDAFKTKWLFAITGQTTKGPIESPTTGVIEGDPDSNTASFAFNKAGTWTVTVQVRDKDMSKYGTGELNKSFTFYVDVVDQPAITVTGFDENKNEKSMFEETEAADAGGAAYINVGLSFNKCDFPLEVKLHVTNGGGNNPGKFVLQTGTYVQQDPSSEDDYYVTFPTGITDMQVGIKTLDGTQVSRTIGFTVTPSMETTMIVPESGDQPANTYYLGTPATLKVSNVAPVVDIADLYPQPSTNRIEAAIGTTDPISWNFTDVAADFTGGITVTVKGGSGYSDTVYTSAEAAGSFSPTFTASGEQTVQLTIRDKDNGSVSFFWYYNVAVAKTLRITPAGPTDGNKTTLSKKYAAASGVGEGRVWASGFSSISAFVSQFNCAKAKSWQIYGYGYKVGDIDNGQEWNYHYPFVQSEGLRTNYYAAHATPISPSGESMSVPTFSYAYPDATLDSFLYTFIQITRDDEANTMSDTLLNGATTPEYAEKVNAGVSVGLPTEVLDDGSYDDTIVEAVFSKEILPADNMGDINWDYIPDVYLDKYTFSTTTTSENERGQVSETETTADDLDSLASYNEDGDYLPMNVDASGTFFDASLSNAYPFTAKLEIRGFGDNFNDATAQRFPDGTANLSAIVGIKPNQVYTNPNEDTNSTLTDAEYLAWTEYAAANGITDLADVANWSRWSPERPTSPTNDDTDEDGFSDAFEYFFWYRAHVGYFDTLGIHRHLTGRRFDPRNPGEGTLITSAEIEQIMDPIVSAGVTALTRDTDNDGLPDLLEYYLGTNPIDFDTDGDGLPDGWELTRAGTDPLKAYTDDTVHDSLRNFDGDAMAITSPKLEESVIPTPFHIEKFTTFAAVDPRASVYEGGDSDGIQWYATKDASALTLDEAHVTTATESYYVFTVSTVLKQVKYASTAYPFVAEVAGVKRLAQDVDAYLLNEDGVTLLPVHLTAGALVTEVPAWDAQAPEASKTDCTVYYTATNVAADVLNSAWVYGRNSNLDVRKGEFPDSANDFGCLAIGRPKGLAANARICWLPSEEIDVAVLHYLVYQDFGFDPRTAWSANGSTGARWSVTQDGEIMDGLYYVRQGGYCGYATRTRAFTAYDEFLVMSFFMNNGAFVTEKEGVVEILADIIPSVLDNSWQTIWNRYTTNPRGPGETIASSVTTDSEAGSSVESATVSDNGADTDLDGVPDGWELYIMAGPKKDGAYVFAPPYLGFLPSLGYEVTKESYWSPFVDAAKTTDTMNQLYIGKPAAKDTLNEFREFGGTDTIAYYAEFAPSAGEATIVRAEQDAAWVNKFWPTDPWSSDTDNDGVTDSDEGDVFVYEGNAETNTVRWVAGGGLNPCTVDTDLDGLPDGWEKQFKGKTVDDTPANGYIDGMDGTVQDAVTTPGKVNRDYDHDGLENWQEYLVGTMRCWRYDDPLTPFTAIPAEAYLDAQGVFSATNAAVKFGCDTSAADGGVGEFWYKTLVDRTSPIYNPHLVSDTCMGPFFSRVTNPWDCAFMDPGTVSGARTGGAYYYFKDRLGADTIEDVWFGSADNPGPLLTGTALADVALAGGTFRTTPSKYISCSPLKADSDNDGMDDYYELFHGMNPLLGASGVIESSLAPCDLVYDAWYSEGSVTLEAWGSGQTRNYWQNALEEKARGTKFDFEVFPWLNGLATADPDGDDIRNQSEAIMPLQATDTWLHSDPTPLWMTDSSYSNSLTRLFFRVPARFSAVTLDGESFDYDGTTYFFRDFDCFSQDLTGLAPVYSFEPFSPDAWNVAADGFYNWIASFEENEGFDTDHDGVSDYDEAQGLVRGATDVQDADSPRRRQAIYFPGENAALQTMPTKVEAHPLAATDFPSDPAFFTYTVECWAKPERLTDQTVLERAIWSAESNPGDKEFLRCNFQIAIKNGKWYTKFDPNGTLVSPVEVYSGTAATTEWTHLAATYDGDELVLYVNGVAQVPAITSLQPENGTSARSLHDSYGYEMGFKFRPGDYWFGYDYSYVAILVGASFKPQTEDGSFKYLDLSQAMGWGGYKNFFKGYVDEIRIWDGARSASEIIDSMKSRFSRDEALENRMTFYKEWIGGKRRYAKDSNGDDIVMTPELRYHFAFDSVFGGADEQSLITAPNGFELAGGKALLSRPVGYQIDWWKKILNGYGSVYAGNTNWVTWIPNTVAHLPRYDGTTLDSVFWSANSCGATNGTYAFARTAEPASFWMQFAYNKNLANSAYGTTSSRYHWINDLDAIGSNSTQWAQFEFTGRHLNQIGDDLLPLGGAYARYSADMWDGEGASSPWEVTGGDADGNTLPDWWEEYARRNYCFPADGSTVRIRPGDTLDWGTTILYKGTTEMSAGEAYWRDLASGLAWTKDGLVENAFPQTADFDKTSIPDWWEELYKISGDKGTDDHDNDGLSNYYEYLVGEMLPFGLKLNPRMPKTDTVTLDYFRKIGKLYIGEMITDHDMMEDHWERALEDATTADPTVWDALKDTDEDGWTNFAENRWNGYGIPTLAQLVSHLVGNVEVMDAPTPTINLTIRYNGTHLTADADTSETKETSTTTEDALSVANTASPNLIVRTYTDDAMAVKDTEYSLKPGQSLERSVYLGGWQNRTVRGTMTPGHVDIGSLDIQFAQIPQSDLYSWTDDEGLHLGRPYAEFKEALAKYPNLVQNVQTFQWKSLTTPVSGIGGGVSDEAITIARDSLLQRGYIAVYGERVGTVDLESGAFEFNMGAMLDVLEKTYDASYGENASWSIKEAIFRFNYSAQVPSVQANRFAVSLAQPDEGFVKGGKNSIMAFYDLDSDGDYTPGEPMGVVRDVEVGWFSTSAEIELTDMSAITPRVELDTDLNDRAVRWGTQSTSNRSEIAAASASLVRVRVVRAMVDGAYLTTLAYPDRVILDRTYDLENRGFIHEGDFLSEDSFDLDWENLFTDIKGSGKTTISDGMLTNVQYLVVLGDANYFWKNNIISVEDTNTVFALSTMLERRFEATRSNPIAKPVSCVFNSARPTFAWSLENEDSYAARFGTTYTAFKVVVHDLDGNEVYASDITRLPAKNGDGVYTWTAPLCVNMPSPSNPSVTFANLTDYTWQVYVYNAKFRWDANPSEAETFRMNVTAVNGGTFEIGTRVCYRGPATQLAGKVHVQAFESPDFTGAAAAETILADLTTLDLAATNAALANVTLSGLPAGTYFLRAYIDTNGNAARDAWESWGYLNERDQAVQTDIFTPVSISVGSDLGTPTVRQIHIEDCDTDGDWFPDVWEAEQNGNEFDRTKIGPVTGNAQLIGVNTNLNVSLSETVPALAALATKSGLALLSGKSASAVRTTQAADGSLAVSTAAGVVEGSVSITGFKLDTDAGEVVLKVGATVEAAAEDPTITALYNVVVSTSSKVTVKVFRIATLAEKWSETPYYTAEVEISSGEADVHVALPDGVDLTSGFYKVVIDQ